MRYSTSPSDEASRRTYARLRLLDVLDPTLFSTVSISSYRIRCAGSFPNRERDLRSNRQSPAHDASSERITVSEWEAQSLALFESPGMSPPLVVLKQTPTFGTFHERSGSGIRNLPGLRSKQEAIQCLTMGDHSPEKAGVGGSIPSLATIIISV